jgi:hypothetical protein
MHWTLWFGLIAYSLFLCFLLVGLLLKIGDMMYWHERQAKALEEIAEASEQWAARYTRRKRKSEMTEKETV